jgi:hypothetical protein
MEDDRKESIDDKPSYDGTEHEHVMRDVEKQEHDQRARRRASKYEDPFGDEEDAEVKYKTMAWWQASSECDPGHP